MGKALSKRSRQLLYIAVIAVTFSLLSIGYKTTIGVEEAQTLSRADCTNPEKAIGLEEQCFDLINRSQLTSLSP